VWNGSSWRDKTVLLRSLHGLGDAIQFIRYGVLLKEQCRVLIVQARRILMPLLQTLPFIDAAVPLEADPTYDVAIECTELPYAFRTTLETIPCSFPYIRANGRPARPRSDGVRRAGLAWASGPWNASRSIGLSGLAPLGTVPGLVFRSLQWGPEWVEAQTRGHGLNIENPGEPPVEDLLETAAIIGGLDLVITVDTMVAHLAGAMGKPVWLLLPFDCDWRWLADGETSPWYPSMRLFRQPRRGDWAVPVLRISEELRNVPG
jgi:hypothetical protein